jgi:hypothetical protein
MITASESKKRSSRRSGLIVSLVFLAVGGLLLYLLFVQPLMAIVQSQAWTPTPCTIRSSRVHEQRNSKGSRTYRPEICYEYTVQGRSYLSSRYDWVGASSGSPQEIQTIVDRLRPGQETLCYVDPARPSEAVLDRSWRATFLFRLLPGIFIGIGVVGLVLTFRPARTRAPLQEGGAKVPGASRAMESPGPKTLRPTTPPWASFFGTLVIALFWNGITGSILWSLILEWRRGNHAWVPTLFLIPFVGIGLIIVFALIRSMLILLNPKVSLTLGSGRVPLGEKIELRWESANDLSRIERYRITLRGKEKATFRFGRKTRVREETFCELLLAEGPGGEDLRSGSTALTVPHDSVPSFRSQYCAIVWELRLEGKIPAWPDLRSDFEIEVVPGEER